MMKKINLELNRESAAVLLRCLSYGESFTSQQDGVAKIIRCNCDLIRKDLCRQLGQQLIDEAVEKGR